MAIFYCHLKAVLYTYLYQELGNEIKKRRISKIEWVNLIIGLGSWTASAPLLKMLQEVPIKIKCENKINKGKENAMA